MIALTVNGTPLEIDVDAAKPLLWVLRDDLRLKGTKYGCGVGVCGICTVRLGGRAVRACVTAAGDADGAEVQTIEGLAGSGSAVIDAWIAAQVPQCGYCQPGQVMAAAALLAEHPRPNKAEVTHAMGGILCRCGTYLRIRDAIALAAKGERSHVPEPSGSAASAAEGAALAPNPWVRVAPDGRVTVLIDRSEMGQGVITGLATLIAEELEVPLERVHIAFAPAAEEYANPALGGQMTGGSTSIRAAWKPLRIAGAQARELLISAAATRWGAAAQDCIARDGEVRHPASGRSLPYGALVEDAKRLPVPKNPRSSPRSSFV